uniref:Maf-like protein CV_0124 n=1 Tax=Arundo donax TaxID=35708 RepID=A0A0A9DLT8_ARUDO
MLSFIRLACLSLIVCPLHYRIQQLWWQHPKTIPRLPSQGSGFANFYYAVMPLSHSLSLSLSYCRLMRGWYLGSQAACCLSIH